MSRKRLINFFGFLMIAFVLAFQGGGSASIAKAATINVRIYGMLDYDAAKQILDMVNEARSSYGLAPLVTNTTLQEYAMLRAQEQAITWEHTRPNGTRGIDGIPNKKNIYGENIAYGYASAAAAMTGWMNSSGHRENILRPEFTQIGVGCYYTNGTWYWAQCFNGNTGSSTVPSGIQYRTTSIETDPGLLNLVMAGSSGEVKEGATLSLHIMQQNPHVSSRVELLPSNFSWSSANPSIATVTNEGVLTGRSAGEAEIYASLSGYGTRSGRIPVVHSAGSPATCTAAQTCTACGTVLTPALGHMPGTEATCTADQKCKRCGSTIKAKLGHSPGAEATCTTAQKCTRCGTTLASAKGHSYVKTVVKPTRTSSGYTLHKCQRCSSSYKTDYVPATRQSSGSSSSGSSSKTPSKTSSSSAKSSSSNGSTKKSTASSITIQWKADARAKAGYAVAVKSGSQYVVVDFVRKGKTTYTLKRIGSRSLKAGTTYTIWIIPVQKSGQTKVLLTSGNNIFKASTAPKAVTLSSAVRKSGTKAALKWKKVSGASGYQIQMSKKSSSGFKTVKTLSSGKKSYTKTGLSKKSAYYFRIRAYRKVNGKYVYGAWSKVKKMK